MNIDPQLFIYVELTFHQQKMYSMHKLATYSLSILNIIKGKRKKESLCIE
jgi:hypothetical protein